MVFFYCFIGARTLSGCNGTESGMFCLQCTILIFKNNVCIVCVCHRSSLKVSYLETPGRQYIDVYVLRGSSPLLVNNCTSAHTPSCYTQICHIFLD